jgi:replication factor C subunit 2/4
MSSSTESTPWVERYRPKSLAEVSHQNEVVATLQNATATGRLPHLLLYGPPGSGKVGTCTLRERELRYDTIRYEP